MIDHVTIGVRDYESAKRFYAGAFAPLGFAVTLDWRDRKRAYLALPGEPSSLWLVQSEDRRGVALSLAAGDRATVDEFHAAATANGGTTIAPPGPRPAYTAATYGAEVLDPDGNVLEVVCRQTDSRAVKRAA